ncbi:autophagy protein, putative [Theileria equi strain WA]|uniref:Autophagy protein, putative n=1 Tax=Theileria equi strain WA TaxID=1537102 RepID=L1LFQ3_THEEQ|nr:autophagy protein, putative [Theileria equi strain WA]EKX74104.1 autophagy protein, putative [Theileria equi strain WA]|eukprot:XP_004833556.1 autophagy protein, putative [Theileria equi strain WA]
MQLLRFIPQIYNIDVSFFIKLYENKLYRYKSSCSRVRLFGLFMLDGVLRLDKHSFEDKCCRFEDCKSNSGSLRDRRALEETYLAETVDSVGYGEEKCSCVLVEGLLILSESLEAFRNLDKEKEIRNILSVKGSNEDSSEFAPKTQSVYRFSDSNRFVVFAFVDLKGHACHYSICSPLVYPETPYTISSRSDVCSINKGDLDIILEFCKNNPLKCPIFVYNRSSGVVTNLFDCTFLDDTLSITDETLRLEDLFFCSLSNLECGDALYRYWRSFLLQFTLANGVFSKVVHVVIIGLSELERDGDVKYKLYGIWVPQEIKFERLSISHGFKGSQSGTKYEHYYSFSDYLDPRKVCKLDEELNLQLMTWRVVPELKLDRISRLNVGIIGVGALGSSIARQLLSWGIGDFTIVDNGTVSNATRQGLYTHEDCLKRTPKVEAANTMIKRIRPDANVKSLFLRIPMPGHYESQEDINNAVNAMEEIMDSCDVLFLSTDSKESRWLPSLLASVRNFKGDNTPLVISVGLAFDSLMIIRHSFREFVGACYFCSESSVLQDTISGRPIDETCTIVKPGISTTCASLAVELLVNLTQHESGFAAPHGSTSCLGCIPHSIRLSISDLKISQLFAEPSDSCICCSNRIFSSFINDEKFLQKVYKDTKYLAKVSGLTSIASKCGDYTIATDGDFIIL